MAFKLDTRQLDNKTQSIKSVGIAIEQHKIITSQKQQEEIQKQLDVAKQQSEPKPSPLARIIPTAKASGSCGDWMNQAGVTDHQNAHILIMRESGCRPTARNASSGAYGIPQSLPASKIAHCGDEPVCQIRWMQDYVVRRYGSWAGAVQHSNIKGWY